MHRVLVIVFEDETKAEQARNELLRLDKEGSVSIYGYEVLVKTADSVVVAKELDGRGTLSPFAKSLIGNLDDSTSLNERAQTVRTGEPAVDSNLTETGKNFMRDVAELLLPDRVAIVAEIEEEWTSLLDKGMEATGGVVFRWTVSEAQHAIEV